METVFIVLLVIVILAQTALFVLHFREKRRSDRRYDTMLAYVDNTVEMKFSSYHRDVEEMLRAFYEKIDTQIEIRDEKAEQRKIEFLQDVQKELDARDKEVSERMNSLLLDYSQAQTAANKINDFSASLASIFDYDPIKAIQKGRKKEAG